MTATPPPQAVESFSNREPYATLGNVPSPAPPMKCTTQKGMRSEVRTQAPVGSNSQRLGAEFKPVLPSSPTRLVSRVIEVTIEDPAGSARLASILGCCIGFFIIQDVVGRNSATKIISIIFGWPASIKPVSTESAITSRTTGGAVARGGLDAMRWEIMGFQSAGRIFDLDPREPTTSPTYPHRRRADFACYRDSCSWSVLLTLGMQLLPVHLGSILRLGTVPV